MDVLTQLGMGFQVALQPMNLFYCFMVCLIGTMVGVLPGLGPTAAMSLLLPATFHVPPVSAIIMLAGIYYGAMYGGCLLYTSPSPRDYAASRMPSSA